MKRNFNLVVLDSDGRPHVRQVLKYDAKGLPVIENNIHAHDHFEPMTMRQYALDALAGRWRGEEALSNEDMWKRMKLHDRIAFADGPVELTTEEGQLILDALNRSGKPALVIGRMKQLFETDPPTAAAA